ncbi:mucin-5AC-like [Haliotis rufescens]|uniref:mucin-5AC-like n=1 Tax=Haliotis rufescens TaxID=6454 RepID=UPI00201EC143|nr:mucin-5AC-like [Haliotis rufescens]
MNKQYTFFNAEVEAEGNIKFVNIGCVDPQKIEKGPTVQQSGTMQPNFVPVIMPNQTFTRVPSGTESVGPGPLRFLTGSTGSSVSSMIMSQLASLPVLQNTGSTMQVIPSSKFMAGNSTASVVGQTLPVMQCVSGSFQASNTLQVIQNQANIQMVQNQPSASASILRNSHTSNIQILQNPSQNAIQVMTAPSQVVQNEPPSNPQITHQPSLQNQSQNAIQVMSAPSQVVQPQSNPPIIQQPHLQIIQTPSGELQLVPVEQTMPANSFSNAVSILKPQRVVGNKKVITEAKSLIKKEIGSDDQSVASEKSPSAANPILNNLLKKVRSRMDNNRQKKASVAKEESSKAQAKQLPNILPKVKLLTPEELLKQHQEVHINQPVQNETETKTSDDKDADKDDDKPVVIIKDQHKENMEDKITFAGTSVKPKFAIEFSPNNLQAYVQAVANAVETHKTMSEQSKLELKIKRKKVRSKCVEEECFLMAEVPKESASVPKASRRKQTLAVRKDPFDGCEMVVEPYKRQPRKRKKAAASAESAVPPAKMTNSQTDVTLHDTENSVEVVPTPDPETNQKQKSPPREIGIFIPPTMSNSFSSSSKKFKPQYQVKDKESISSSSSSLSTTSTVSVPTSSLQNSDESVLPVPVNEIKIEPQEKTVSPSNTIPCKLKNVSSNDKITKDRPVKQSKCETLSHISSNTEASRNPCPLPMASIKVETLSSGYDSSPCRKIIKKNLNFGSTEVARLTAISKMPSPLPKPMSPSKTVAAPRPCIEPPKENVPHSAPEPTSVEQLLEQQSTVYQYSVLPTSRHTKSVQQSQQHLSALNQALMQRVTEFKKVFNSVVRVNTNLPEGHVLEESQQFPLPSSKQPSVMQSSVEQSSVEQSAVHLSQDHLTAVHQTMVEGVTAFQKVFSSVTSTNTKPPEGTASEGPKVSIAETPILATNTIISQENSLQTTLGNQSIQTGFLTPAVQEDPSGTPKPNGLLLPATVNVVQPTIGPTKLPTVNSSVTVPVTPLYSSNFMQVPSISRPSLNIVNHANQQKKVYVVPSSLYTALVAQANSGKPVRLTSAQLMASLEQTASGTMAIPKTLIDASDVKLVKKQDEYKSPLIPVPVTDLLRTDNNPDVCEDTDIGLMELKIESVFSLNKVCCKLMDKVPSYLDMCLNSKLEHSLKLCFVVLDDSLPPLFRGIAGTKRTRFKMPKACTESCRTQALDSMCVKNKWRNIRFGEGNSQTFSEPVTKCAKRE